MVVGVIHNTELPGRNTLNGLLGVDDITSATQRFEMSAMKLGRVTNLECHLARLGLKGQEVEVAYGKRVAVNLLRVVALGDIKHIALHILANDIPRTTAQTQSVPLPDGVKPQSLVAADDLSAVDVDHLAGIFAQITAHIVVILDFAKEADALRILALGIDEVFVFGNFSKFFLAVMTDGEYGFLELPRMYLCQEVGLVFRRGRDWW